MYSTASATSRTPIWGSGTTEPSAWSAPLPKPCVISVTALPTSICPQAIPYLRPSSEIALVSPVIACLVAVYAAACGRGTCAEIEPLLMIRPPPRRFMAVEGLARAQERAGQIRIDHSLPVGQGELFEGRGRPKYPGIVEEQVDPAKPFLRLPEQGPNRRFPGYVRRHHEAGGSVIAQGLVQFGLAPAGQDHVVAGIEQGHRHRPADARTRPRHHGYRICATGLLAHRNPRLLSSAVRGPGGCSRRLRAPSRSRLKAGAPGNREFGEIVSS